jgi:phosphorylcholine metabolism protein LicD
MAGNRRLEGQSHRKALQMLEEITRLMEKSHLNYWLEGGTLLGIVRENRLLPWDNDLDLSIRSNELGTVMRLRLSIWLKGYRIRVRRHPVADPPLAAGTVRLLKITTRRWFFLNGDVRMDVFVKYKSDNEYLWTVGKKNRVKKSVPARFYESLTTINFNGKTYQIPLDYDGYLSYRYGDWRTPVQEWNFRKDDQAILNENKML